VTISGTIAGIQYLANHAGLVAACIQQLTTFFATTQFTGGIELDVEDFSSWTVQQYSAYKNVVTALGNALHAAGLKLMVDGPVILNAQYQGYYPNWRYEDFQNLPVDAIVTMCYDLNFDNGTGTPVASLKNITDCCTWMKSKIADPNRIVIGLNSYGYAGLTNTPNTPEYSATQKTYQQLAQIPGFSTAKRDPTSGELIWQQGDMSYDYSDSVTINGKIAAVLATGLTQVSIWSLGGGNPWPTIVQPIPDPVLNAFTTKYPGFASWYAANFDANGNYIGK
jgi:spore germination protein YaaH